MSVVEALIDAILDLLLWAIDCEYYPEAVLAIILAIALAGGCRLQCNVESQTAALPAEAP